MSDPSGVHIDPDVSRRLYDWAMSNGAAAQQLGVPWRAKDAIWTARLRIGLPYGRQGLWVKFDDAVAAVVDDDRADLLEALAALGV